MVITHVVNRRKLCLTVLATILIAVLLEAPRAGATLTPDEPIPYAQVMAVIVGNKVVEEAGAPQVVITRGPNGCPATTVVRKGLPLCKDDHIKTRKEVLLKIAFGDPKDRDEVTIGSPEEESEITISSTSCGRICQWFSSLRSTFTNRTRRVAFTNKGTVYLVEGEKDHFVTLYVFEGSVEAKKRDDAESDTNADATPKAEDSPAPSPSPAAQTEPAASPAPTPEPTATPAPDPSPAPTSEPTATPAPDPSPNPTPEPTASSSPGPSPAAVTEPSPDPSPTTENPWLVKGLFQRKFDPEGNPTGPPERMDSEFVCGKLAPSTSAEIAIHGTPAEVAGNVTKFLNEPDIGTRKDNFRKFRCRSFNLHNNPENFERLGYIYNDWGNAERAREFLNTAVEKWQLQNANAQLTSWSSWDKIRINRAMALRQLGKHDDALKELDPMTTKSDLLDDAFNVRGSINYDLARKKLFGDRTEAGTTKAKELLDQAKQDYEEASKTTPAQQQYVTMNLAQVSKTRGDLARRLGDLATDTTQRDANYLEAVQNYRSAIDLLEALDKKGNNRKIARLLGARAYTALANTYTAMGKTEDSVSNYEKAKRAYRGAIKEADTFADAYCGLASLNMILREPEMTENYGKCVTFDASAFISEVEIPHVVGLRLADAIEILAEVGLGAEIVTQGEIVASQDPAPGEQSEPQKAKIGTRIKLSLRGPEQP